MKDTQALILKKPTRISSMAAVNLRSIDLTVDIVTAYVSRNAINAAELPKLIQATHAAIVAPLPAKPVRTRPLVSIAKSVTPDYIISLENGKPYRSLTRHLASRGMKVEEYLHKWGLPPTYPMNAPNYSKKRSELAKASGLGLRRWT